MTRADLDKPAELTVWLAHRAADTARGCQYATLRQALSAAAEAIRRTTLTC